MNYYGFNNPVYRCDRCGAIVEFKLNRPYPRLDNFVTTYADYIQYEIKQDHYTFGDERYKEGAVINLCGNCSEKLHKFLTNKEA